MRFSKLSIEFSCFNFILFNSHMQLPRKKRDFYGKSHRSSRHINKPDVSLSNKTRPSSTPAICTEILSTTILPDRPVSIPPN